jgi:hypothetical protein
VGDKDSIIELSDEDDEFKTPPPAKSTYVSLLCFGEGG